ncbi:hypothetical protein [Undibacterium flavidum]|uniref:Uncharacterized protein n=1 Tax=Undibacterium flavidum TaxID=2762297 RepID=A0ABR6YEQ8_9BURK|nr:hypothetical protein [Undibacterium flavidum]MBC3875033.1 hypothetical protein [Undibacterium flavidum]
MSDQQNVVANPAQAAEPNVSANTSESIGSSTNSTSIANSLKDDKQNKRDNQRLQAAIQDAQILVAYAAECGSSIDESVIRVIVSSGSLYSQNAMDDDTETAFWLAYNTLAKNVAPVTVNSLQAILDPQPGDTRKLWGMEIPKDSLARRAVRGYTVLAIVTLCTLLTIQIYWLFGKQISGDIQTITDKHTDAKAKWEAARLQAINSTPKNTNKATTGNAKDAATGAVTGTSAEDKDSSTISSGNVVQDTSLFTLKAQEQTYLLHKKSSYESLHVWSRIWAIFLPNPQIEVDDPGEKRIYDNSIILQSSNLLLDALQRYLLPLLYGLLGTCVYVLRTLSSEISARTYSEASNIGFRIRLYLGTLGGMVFAWFVIPDQTDGLFKSLSPFALAFLAGYSVEILFAAMDRFLVAFTNKQA